MRPFNYKYLPDVPSGLIDNKSHYINLYEVRLNRLHRAVNRHFHTINGFDFLLNSGDREELFLDDEC